MNYSAAVTLHLTSKTGICGVFGMFGYSGTFKYFHAQFAYLRGVL
jgi:hypothetical protein